MYLEQSYLFQRPPQTTTMGPNDRDCGVYFQDRNTAEKVNRDSSHNRGRPLHRSNLHLLCRFLYIQSGLSSTGPVTDYGTPVATWMTNRSMGWRNIYYCSLRPTLPWTIDVSIYMVLTLRQRISNISVQLLPPTASTDNPAMSIPTKHIHASLNKIKHPINVVKVSIIQMWRVQVLMYVRSGLPKGDGY
jgi:hypothetical protein